MDKVKILGISGSPRKGNTEILVKEALNAAEKIADVETEFVSLHGKKINPCLDCDGCRRNKSLCVQKDDMAEIFPKIMEADAIIIGTPVYMHTVSAQTKALMDRHKCLYVGVHADLSNKVGGAIAVGWDRYGGEEHAIETIIHFMLSLDMIVVSGYAPKSYIGAAALQRHKGPEGTRRLDAVIEDEEGMKAARDLGERVAMTARLIKAGLKAR